jgi:hypothetical protein
MKMFIVYACKVRSFAQNPFIKSKRLFANNETAPHRSNQAYICRRVTADGEIPKIS